MRFHIGVSKRIKFSTLLKILSGLLIGFLGYLGLVEHVSAEEVYNYKFCNDLGNTVTHYSNFRNNVISDMSLNRVTARKEYCNNSSSTYDKATLFEYTSPVANVKSTSYDSHALQYGYVNINNSLCNSNMEGNVNSVDVYFLFYANNIDYANSILTSEAYNNHFGTLTDYSDVFEFQLGANTSEINLTPQTCSIQTDSTSVGQFNVACYGVTWNEDVTSYTLSVFNKVYYNLENKDNIFYLNNNFSYTSYFFSTLNVGRYIDYNCTRFEPNPPTVIVSGDSNIDFDSLNNDGSSASVLFPENNLNLSWYNDLDIDETLTNAFSLPYRLVDLILNGSLDSCTPISINFSSLTRRFGGSDYYLQVPCMRTVLSNYLGVNIIGNFTLYGLADLFTAVFLFIWFAQKFWFAIQDMLSGHDVKDYLRIG